MSNFIKIGQAQTPIPIPQRKGPPPQIVDEKNKAKSPTQPAVQTGEPKNSNIPLPVKQTPTAQSPSTTKQTQNLSGTESIREMQEAMQSLAQSVIMDSKSLNMARKPGDAVHQEAGTNTKESKRAFNNFIAEQYVGELDSSKKGAEWDTNPTVVKYQPKKQTQTDIYELDVVMNTLQRLGTEKSEFKADGNWEFRTDNALKNIMGFAYALLELEGDFGLDNKIYSPGNWNALYKDLSGYTVKNGQVQLSPQEKQLRAKRITKQLEVIKNLYNHFRQLVTSRPEYRPFIEGSRNFDAFSKGGTNKDYLTKQDQEYINNKKPSVKLNSYFIAPSMPEKKHNSIPMEALMSKEKYFEYMSKLGNNENMAKNIFEKIVKPQFSV